MSYSSSGQQPPSLTHDAVLKMARTLQDDAMNRQQRIQPIMQVIHCSKIKANNGQVSVEAFQVSQQCMKMVAEEALEVNGDDLKFCQVNETFTAIQEGKGSKTVDNNFFITVVPIIQHTSDLMIADFPNMNRDIDDRTPSNHELKIQLSKSGTAGWTFIDRLADFNLLIYISQFLDVKEDLSKICKSISDKNISLDDGYKILIKSIAGLEGSY